VVVVGIDPAEDVVYLNDAAQRKLLKQERASFEKQWAAVEHWTLLALPSDWPHKVLRTSVLLITALCCLPTFCLPVFYLPDFYLRDPAQTDPRRQPSSFLSRSAGRTCAAFAARAAQSPDLDYYYGVALAHLERWVEAGRALSAGQRLASNDKRFPIELAGVAFKQKITERPSVICIARCGLILKMPTPMNFWRPFISLKVISKRHSSTGTGQGSRNR